jgi:carbon-monoxide dehydrogenase large subunit
VALVLAETRYIAEDAADLVVVDYDPLTPVPDYRTATESDELVHEGHGSNLIGEIPGLPLSALQDVLDASAHVVQQSLYQQAYAPVPMEGRAILVDANRGTGEITMYSATQAPHEVRAFGARLLGVPEHQVRVISRDTGGAFGQKIMVQRDEQAIMLAGFKVGVPVKWVEDRRENLMAAGQSRHEHGDLTVALDADGVIQAMGIDYVCDCGAYPTPWPVGTSAVVGILFPGPYRVSKASFRARTVYSNTVGRAAYRGPWAYETLAREVLLDNAARVAGVDPIELRRKNLLSLSEMPYPGPNGMTFDHSSPLETFEEAIRILDYEAFRKEQAEARAAGRYIGVGTSSYIEPTTPSFGYYGTEAATIRIEPSGAVNVYMAGGSAGNSVETAAAQLTADALGVPIDAVHCFFGDTSVTGFGAGTAGSRSGAMTAGAVDATASILKERIVAIAANKLEASVDDIELEDGRAIVRGTPAVGLSLAEIAGMAYFDMASLPADVPPGLEATARFKAAAPSTWANASHVCTCEVDVETGQVTLLRYIVSEDCGPMINPNVVEGQIAGGAVQGIGGALLEELAWDEDGNPMSTTFVDYLMPTSTEVPTIEYGHVETPAPGPGGYKGVGEGGAIGAPPAVVNAIADALAPFGIPPVTQLPLTPERILDLIG